MFDPRKDDFKTVSSIYGKIEEVLLTFPGSGSGRTVKVSQILHEYGGIWKSLNNRVKFYVLANHHSKALHTLIGREYEAALEQLVDSENYELVPIVADMDSDDHGLPPVNRQFAQDPFLIQEDRDGNRAILEPYSFGNLGDRHVAEMLAAQTDFVIQPTRYDLEGGNILIGDDYAVLGADTFRKNLKFFAGIDSKQAEKLLRRHLKKILGVSYLIVPQIVHAPRPPRQKYGLHIGDGYQALYHQDLYLTLGGKHPEKNEELIYVAKLATYKDPENPNHPRSRVENRDEYDWVANALDKTAEFFHNYNKNAPGPKFFVVRVPLVYQHVPDDDPILRSYNNCLAEYHEGRRTFYLPKYEGHDDLIRINESLEKKVENAFSSYESSVIWVNGNFTQLSKEAASLHCITKVLRRRK